MINLILQYPALLLLPVFTFFADGTKNLSCAMPKTTKSQLVVSERSTLINIAITIISYGIPAIMYHSLEYYAYTLDRTDINLTGLYASLFFNLAGVFPVLLIAILITLIFLSLNLECCFSRAQHCFCLGCCGPQCYENRRKCLNTEVDRHNIESIQLA